MSPRYGAQLMNKLVKHMEKHHAPIGTAYESTRPETMMKETWWTRKEIFEMALEDKKATISANL